MVRKKSAVTEIVEEEREKTCRGKKIYRTMGYARNKAGLSMKFHPEEELQAYKCPFGKHYHIGHRPKEPRDRGDLRALMYKV